MKKSFEVVKFNSRRFNEKVKDIAESYNGNPSPFKKLLEHLKAPPYSCKIAVIEIDYVDADYQDEFSAFYSKSFKNYLGRSTRIHFFAEDNIPQPTKAELSDYTKHVKSYLGFVVIRPTDLQRLGRTAIRPNIQDSHLEFVHCLAKFNTHICGQRLSVKAMPFIQQDTQVGACAQASLWMVARYMSTRFGYREFLPSEINLFAKSHDSMGRPLPAARGLDWHQMLNALDKMDLSALSYSLSEVDGCSPDIDNNFPFPPDTGNPTAYKRLVEETTQKRRKVKLASIAYRYIESGFPVIFGTKNHVMVCIGHTYDPNKIAQLAIQRIPKFIVHDDARGPYLKMPIFEESNTDRCFEEVNSIIVVVPTEVTLPGEEAETLAMSSISKLLDMPTRIEKSTMKETLLTINPQLETALTSLEYRTYLSTSVDFQAQIRKDIEEGRFHKELGKELLEFDYPKFIWIIEISSSEYLNSSDRKKRKCIGRVIIDSTAPAKTDAQINIHFCGLFIPFNRQRESSLDQNQIIYYKGSTPFGHRISEEQQDLSQE